MFWFIKNIAIFNSILVILSITVFYNLCLDNKFFIKLNFTKLLFINSEIDLEKKASQLNVTPGFIKFLEEQKKANNPTRKHKQVTIGRKSLPSKRACTSGF